MKLLIEDYNLQLDSREEYHDDDHYFSHTPLHRAISLNNVEAVKMLLEYGADPELGGIEVGEEFQNALQLASRRWTLTARHFVFLESAAMAVRVR